MNREKRSAQIRGNIFPSMREELKELIAEEKGKVISISDWLFEVVDERLAMRSVRISKQRIGRRFGNQ